MSYKTEDTSRLEAIVARLKALEEKVASLSKPAPDKKSNGSKPRE